MAGVMLGAALRLQVAFLPVGLRLLDEFLFLMLYCARNTRRIYTAIKPYLIRFSP